MASAFHCGTLPSVYCLSSLARVVPRGVDVKERRRMRPRIPVPPSACDAGTTSMPSTRGRGGGRA
eukprot:CAMPEP_0185202366 /NCGR_PEP_ID=MMETSP1140-20130426/50999_1 /TAXON_ID=298111 /ORGANISM="Pavlova sp., Strain CCMP459" /LENGTH=64 /DNA_ID=CAMNT_0027769801 /DNA_START=104 /DNA_END=295 /DNA_ORIENTATION=+